MLGFKYASAPAGVREPKGPNDPVLDDPGGWDPDEEEGGSGGGGGGGGGRLPDDPGPYDDDGGRDPGGDPDNDGTNDGPSGPGEPRGPDQPREPRSDPGDWQEWLERSRRLAIYDQAGSPLWQSPNTNVAGTDMNVYAPAGGQSTSVGDPEAPYNVGPMSLEALGLDDGTVQIPNLSGVVGPMGAMPPELRRQLATYVGQTAARLPAGPDPDPEEFEAASIQARDAFEGNLNSSIRLAQALSTPTLGRSRLGTETLENRGVGGMGRLGVGRLRGIGSRLGGGTPRYFQ